MKFSSLTGPDYLHNKRTLSWHCRGSKAHRVYNYWKCGRALKKGQSCCPDAHLVNEIDLINITCSVLGVTELSDELLDNRLEYIEGGGENGFVFHLKEQEVRGYA